MKLSKIILSEANYTPYRAMVQVTSREASTDGLASLLVTCTIAL